MVLSVRVVHGQVGSGLVRFGQVGSGQGEKVRVKGREEDQARWRCCGVMLT